MTLSFGSTQPVCLSTRPSQQRHHIFSDLIFTLFLSIQVIPHFPHHLALDHLSLNFNLRCYRAHPNIVYSIPNTMPTVLSPSRSMISTLRARLVSDFPFASISSNPLVTVYTYPRRPRSAVGLLFVVFSNALVVVGIKSKIAHVQVLKMSLKPERRSDAYA